MPYDNSRAQGKVEKTPLFFFSPIPGQETKVSPAMWHNQTDFPKGGRNFASRWPLDTSCKIISPRVFSLLAHPVDLGIAPEPCKPHP